MVSVLGRPGRGASQVEKSPRLNWTTPFLTVAYDGACSPNVSFRMAWISFGALPREGRTWWQLASPCGWNRARRLTCFLSASVTRKVLRFGTLTNPSFQRHYRFRPTSKGLIITFSWTYMSATLVRKFTSVAAFLQNAFVLFKQIKTSRPKHRAP